jgi:ABC-type antimicrobial peptide transport system permease subunit
LAPGVSKEEFTPKMDAFYKEKNAGTNTDLVLAPVKRMHLFSYFGYKEGMLTGHYVYIFSVIALFVLVVASINFVNLSTSLSLSKAKAIGINKTNGARRIHIIKQFLSESVTLTLASLVLSMLLVYLLLNAFNTFTNKEIVFSVLFSPRSLIYLSLVILFTGIVAGIYPALLISSFQPIAVLKGINNARHGKLTINKGLVVFQMVISILLIVGTSITYKQTHYLKDHKLGFNQKDIIVLNMRGEARQHFQTLKQKLTDFSGVVSVSGSNNMPLDYMGNTGGVRWEGRGANSSILINYKGVNYNYLTTMDIGLVEGRDCSAEYPSDVSSAILINETMKNLMGVENAVGNTLDGWEGERTIIGVTEDFHFSSPRNAVEPLIMLVQPERSSFMFVKSNPEMIAETRDHIQKTWNELIPFIPVNMNYIDLEYENLFSSEEQTASLVMYFTIIAIIIACLGLFGLTSFTLRNKIKEIGIRKVNGAKIVEVLTLINTDIVKWVAIACVISTPIAWFVMSRWLENFAYKTPLNWWIFLFAGITATAIAIITVSWQSWRAATRNPVKALRYE